MPLYYFILIAIKIQKCKYLQFALVIGQVLPVLLNIPNLSPSKYITNIYAPYISLFFSAEVTAKYFGQLSDEDIYNIYTVYEDDFKLFDYHFKFRNISLPT